jgi:ABC-type dipeptide/oligopeptide/nickel transport system ATPase subunit
MSGPAQFNPFVGLRPFEREDSLLFFGRSTQVEFLLELLDRGRFLAVVGSSGCGKSSLIRAGLVPALEAGFLVQDRDLWRIATMKPGEAPLRHLAIAFQPALGESSHDPETVAERMIDEGADALLDVLDKAEDAAGTNLLLLVDQFEELFRFGLTREDPDARGQAEAFVALLLRLAEQRRFPVYVCMTMRSDFLGDCDAFIGLPEAINRGQFLVPRLTRAQRREAIEGPVHLAGGKIAQRLVDRLLNESLDARDDRPILQHLLMRVWDTWSETPDAESIDLEHYERVQGIHKALDRHAQEALDELSEADRPLARRLFQTITELDSGNRRIRRPAHLGEICAVADADADLVMAVIERFRAERRNFLVLSSPNPDDDPLIDISHESLILQWGTLRDWVDQEAESAKLYRRLAETSALEAQGRAGLYREADLEQALEWQSNNRPSPAWAQRYPGDFNQSMNFLARSRKARDDEERHKEQARLERERLLEEKAQLAEQQALQEREAMRKCRRAIAMGSLAYLILLAVAAFAWYI